MQNQPVSSQKKSFGPLLGIIIIVIILVVGAFYVWGGKLSDEAALAPVSASDEVEAIEADLSSGGDLDIDLSELEAELE